MICWELIFFQGVFVTCWIIVWLDGGNGCGWCLSGRRGCFNVSNFLLLSLVPLIRHY